MKYTVFLAVELTAADHQQAAKKGFTQIGKVLDGEKPAKIHLVPHDGNGAYAMLATIQETSVSATATFTIS